ncbi:MAG TPA: DUF4079 domain-containing protein [Coleofasciculaceae cyanobacterium]
MAIELPESVKVWSQFFHPLIMWVLLGLTLYAFYLGIKVRRTRSATGEEKKALVKGQFNLKHYQVGSLILALMVMGSIGGMAVTYINNGKLFVQPHLLAGLGMTGMIAVSAALSPLMQKGADWARYTHIALNLVIVGLFGWQAVTGMQIVQRILDRMQTG